MGEPIILCSPPERVKAYMATMASLVRPLVAASPEAREARIAELLDFRAGWILRDPDVWLWGRAQQGTTLEILVALVANGVPVGTSGAS